MVFPTAEAPLDYTISLGMEPFPTASGPDADVLGRNTITGHPIKGYGFLDYCSLPDCEHLNEWVKVDTTSS